MHLNLKQLRFSGEHMTQYTHESCANMNHMGMLKNPLRHHATSNHIKTQNASPKITMQTLKMNATTVKYLLANETITTCHVRHIFMPINETIKK